MPVSGRGPTIPWSHSSSAGRSRAFAELFQRSRVPVSRRLPPPVGQLLWWVNYLVKVLVKIGDHTTPCLDNISLTSVTSAAIFLQAL
jgi:hypothetical protein